MSAIIFNPVVISILLLFTLCILRVNVLLSIIIASLTAGLISKISIPEIMNTFISGMGDNAETALSYILLGAFAAAMNHTGLTDILSDKIIKFVNGKKNILFIVLILISMASQNIIPIHIAFIPILIPPLLHTMNMMNIDRRAISCILAFGLKMPYITIPIGFGLIFQNLIAENMAQNGMQLLKYNVWKSTWILGVGMFVGLLTALFISYGKSRKYNDILTTDNNKETLTLNYKHYITILAALITFGVQIYTHSLPLGALCGLGIIFSLGAVKHSKMDKLIDEGIYMMGYVAFVMLVASGFATVLKTSGGIETFVNSIISILPETQILTALVMLIAGLIITMGIGTSFGTIPILAVVYIPVFIKTGFNVQQAAVVLAAAAALGDAGSPASDTTLGPTSGLNIDGQHNHIFDTCIPTFLHYNTTLIIFALLGVLLFA